MAGGASAMATAAMTRRRGAGIAAALARWGGGMCSSSSSTAPASVAVLSSQELIRMEQDCSAHNYHPIPMVFSRGEGSHIVDPEGNKYIDFLSAYCAFNQGTRKTLILFISCKSL